MGRLCIEKCLIDEIQAEAYIQVFNMKSKRFSMSDMEEQRQFGCSECGTGGFTLFKVKGADDIEFKHSEELGVLCNGKDKSHGWMRPNDKVCEVITPPNNSSL